MNVRDTAHGNKGNIVQEPSDNRIETRVMDVIDLCGLEILVAALPAYKVPGHVEGEDAKRSGGTPIDDGITK